MNPPWLTRGKEKKGKSYRLLSPSGFQSSNISVPRPEELLILQMEDCKSCNGPGLSTHFSLTKFVLLCMISIGIVCLLR